MLGAKSVAWERGSTEELWPGWTAAGWHDANVPAMLGLHLSVFPGVRREPWMVSRLYPCGSVASSPGRASRGFVLSMYSMNQHTLFSSVGIGLPLLGRRRRLAVDSSAASLGLCCRRGRQDSAAVCVSFGTELLFF